MIGVQERMTVKNCKRQVFKLVRFETYMRGDKEAVYSYAKLRFSRS